MSSRQYFTGIVLRFSSTTNTTQIFTITWKKWNMTQRTLKNKQFNIHKIGVKINEKYNVWVALVEKGFGQLNKNKIVHTCVCV